MTQTSTTNNSTNGQAQQTEVVEVPATQSSRGTTTYTPPRVQNNPAPTSGNSDSSATVTPNTPATVTPTTPNVTTPAASETTGTSE